MQNTQNTHNKNVKIVIIIVAALIVITALIILIYKLNKKPVDTSPNTTVMRYNMGITLTDSDLNDIETLVKNIAGDKFQTIEKGEGYIPPQGNPTDTSGSEILPGDSVTITFSLLDKTQTDDIFNELVGKYGITITFNYDIKDIYRPK
ncbi:MAG: hypothetical protein FWD71_07525 [Oscillospiraceae bacterium]|nr:hypothetical protein [Oscillospiraceae bacterium]